MGDQRYFAAAADLADERARVRLIEAENDPNTIRLLTDLGMTEGWRCLEVGAGGGSITRWLAERVGETGRVVAADIDPRFLADLALTNVEIRRCDITRDALEVDSYDLMHCRFLLTHVPDPAAVLQKMVSALRPGGWILAEEIDVKVMEAVDDDHPLADVFTTSFRRAFEFLRAAQITDGWMGRSLPSLMTAAGLAEIGNQGFTRISSGGEAHSLMWIQSFERVRERLVGEGVLSDAEIAAVQRAFRDPTFSYRDDITQAVWGQRPQT